MAEQLRMRLLTFWRSLPPAMSHRPLQTSLNVHVLEDAGDALVEEQVTASYRDYMRL